MKRAQMLEIVDVLTNLKDQKLPLKLAYRVSRILDKCNREQTFFENERIKLVRTLGVEKESGQIEVPDENRETFVEKISTLLEEEVDVQLPMLPLELFPDAIVISTQDMTKLACLIEEPM